MALMKDKNIVSCLLKRQQGFYGSQNNVVLRHFAEHQTANQSNKYVKCKLSGTPRSTFLVAFSPDGTRLASTHGDHTVRVIDLKNGHCLDTLIGHPRTPWTIAFHPSKHDLLASGCLGGEVRVWDLTRGHSTVFCRSTAIASLAFHPTDMVLLIATDNQLLFWNWEQPAPFVCIDTPCKRQKLRLVKFDPLGQRILTGIRNLPDVFQSPVTRPDRNVTTASALPGTVDPQVGAARNQNASSSGSGEATTHRRFVAHFIQPPVHTHSTSPVLHHYRSSAAIIEPSSRLLSGISSSQITEVLRLTASLQARIDQAIAETLADQGHVAIASNMTGTTCRLQLWDFTKLEMPNLQDPECNVIVPWCKLHNDASTDISNDGHLLAAIVPNVNNTTEFGDICVFSLEQYNLGQCLFSKKVGPNAISVSFSPLGHYIVIGVASRRIYSRQICQGYQPVAQIYQLKKTEESMEYVASLKCPVITYVNSVSTNAAFWNPVLGSGLVYGTNKGEIYLCYTAFQPDSNL